MLEEKNKQSRFVGCYETVINDFNGVEYIRAREYHHPAFDNPSC